MEVTSAMGDGPVDDERARLAHMAYLQVVGGPPPLARVVHTSQELRRRHLMTKRCRCHLISTQIPFGKHKSIIMRLADTSEIRDGAYSDGLRRS